MKEGFNYARFYTLLKKLPGADKETLVEQYTNGRTVHLHRTTMQEYNKMCNDMEQVAGYDERMHRMHEALRKARSGALHQMQLYGIDTADWTRVNAFCRDPRIARQGIPGAGRGRTECAEHEDEDHHQKTKVKPIKTKDNGNKSKHQ